MNNNDVNQNAWLFRPIFTLRGMDTFGKFSAVFDKGDNFCNFLFAYLYIIPLLKKGLL